MLFERVCPVALHRADCGAPPADDVAAVADPPSRRLRAAGRIWPGRTGRNRGGWMAEADALLSAAGPAGGSVGPLHTRGRRAISRARAVGARGYAAGIGRGGAGHLAG